MASSVSELVRELHGPILVLGASGFVGANLVHAIAAVRDDVYGTTSREPAWRLASLPPDRVVCVDLLATESVPSLLRRIKPRTVFDCVAYGAYSFEEEAARIYDTNIRFKTALVEHLLRHEVYCYIHAGSSSEYGARSAGPDEDSPATPNSHYAVSKNAAASLVYFSGKYRGLRCANLRLYAAYGPYEDRSRLMPTLVAHAVDGHLPPFVHPDTSRDFVYIDDAVEAFLAAAVRLKPERYGESFNIGSGRKTTIRELADVARQVFSVAEEPRFSTMESRRWDLSEWYANPGKASECLGWQARTPLAEGLRRTAEWYRALPDPAEYERLSKKYALDRVYSVSAIVACYRDAQAIPIMVERLTRVMTDLKLDFEIILVNDGSPDDSEEVIRGISAENPRVLGITHSRNFGSQSAFRSGMEIATKNACVLLDGDLQDPPELIAKFVEKWREGYEVVYGVRVKREAVWYMRIAYKLFYRLFDYFSDVPIPHDAGDFSLIDRRVVGRLLTFPEKDLFLRGLRAYVGFKQTGVDYVRPERMFGRSTNSLLKNFGWAKKGILSFSKTPLNMLTFSGIALVALTLVLAATQFALRVFLPESAPRGITTVLLAIMFFGSFTIFAISLIGEYIAKIFEEVKARPHFVRRHIVRNGEIRKVIDRD